MLKTEKKRRKRKARMSRRLILILSIFMITTFAAMYYVNTIAVSRYTTYKIHKQLEEAHEAIKKYSYTGFLNNEEYLEKQFDVNLISFYFEYNENYFNDELRRFLSKETITLNRIWLTLEGLNTLRQKKALIRTYDQGDLGTSYTILYTLKDGWVICIGKSIPHSSGLIESFNEINLIMWCLTLFILLIFIVFYMRRVTKPIEKLTTTTENIAHLNFEQVNIRTKDELETLGDSVNLMSERLENALKEIDQQNQNLKRLISDISHETKTPLSLISLYAHGIRDGLDDGTYLPGIIRETEKTSQLIGRIIEYSKTERQNLTLSEFNLNEIIHETIETLQPIAREKEVTINYTGKEQQITADKEKIKSLLNNLIHNAVKYTTDNTVNITLDDTLSIENGFDTTLSSQEITQLFDPFFVLDKARNKETSGTGLGLSICRNILELHGFEYDIKAEGGKFTFIVVFKRNR